jgi:glycine oxidase
MTKVVIIGGGLLGLLSARELALAGCQVEILERGQIGQESSWAGGGILSPLYPWRYADPITELARWSQAHYRDLAESLRADTGIDPEWTRSGLLMLDVQEEEQQQADKWAERFGYRLEHLPSGVVAQMAPQLASTKGTALWMPDVAQIRNPRLLKALHVAVLKAGVVVKEGSPVTAIEQRDGGAIGIRCAEGSVTADKVVICGGAWSGEIARQLGFALPVRPVKGQMLLFRAAPGLLKQVVLSEGFYLVPRRDGHILAGSTMEESGFDKQTTPAARELLLQQALRILPALANAELERQWAGLRPGSPVGVPFIGAVPGVAGLYVNAGQYRNGVVTGLASARLLTDTLLGNPAVLPLQPYHVALD